ncbi:MAG: DUF547 domain-containing protein [Chitinophagaceae bacterium]
MIAPHSGIFRGSLILAFMVVQSCAGVPQHYQVTHPVKTNFMELSQNLLYAARTGDSTSGYQDTLRNADEGNLLSQLSDDNHRKAFWLNIYNAYTQILLHQHPGMYASRNSFFSKRQIPIAGHQLSLDEIENGLLRHSNIKWGLGYLNKLFPSRFEKKFRVDTLDYRIHFALNCGAKSCPPIAFYEPDRINAQLDLATLNYLTNEITYDSASRILKLPATMSWFRGDFGGNKKVIALVRKLGLIPPDAVPHIRYRKYDWTLYLNNFK